MYPEYIYQIFSNLHSQQNLIAYYNNTFLSKAKEYLHFLEEMEGEENLLLKN